MIAVRTAVPDGTPLSLDTLGRSHQKAGDIGSVHDAAVAGPKDVIIHVVSACRFYRLPEIAQPPYVYIKSFDGDPVGDMIGAENFPRGNFPNTNPDVLAEVWLFFDRIADSRPFQIMHPDDPELRIQHFGPIEVYVPKVA